MTTATTYVGWFRPIHGRWQRVAESATSDVALAMAQQYADASGSQHRDLVVLPGGMTPSTRQRRRAARAQAKAVDVSAAEPTP